MAQTTEHIYTPSELNREIRIHLEIGFPRILLEAEISNLARPASGHLYFSLKDDKAQIRCAMFRSSASRMDIQVENGMKVLARGRISLYEPRGDYQLIIDSLRDAGEGILQRRFEELKKKLEAEGLFDPAYKQDLPPYPARIGLITSPSGAAVRDLLHVLGRRWPVAQVRLYPVLVQGNEAPPEIRSAIECANEHGWADTLIIGRGGGSLEDLMAFNDEAVARGVFASSIPVVSAVGHETDFSICDFVADLRAPTPSAAAELATPDQLVLKETFSRAQRQMQRRILDQMQRNTQGLDHLSHRLQQRHPATRLAELSERVTAFGKSIEQLTVAAVRSRRELLGSLVRTLNAVSPLETIGRGYAVVTSAETGDVVISTSQVGPGDRVCAQLKDGKLDCTVDTIE
jgi:exodeoxyribonuclease VII large subunit